VGCEIILSSTKTVADVRASLIERREIALLDVREEGVFAESHPLFAASLPLSRLELEVLDRIPRQTVPIVVYDAGEGLAHKAAARLGDLGYGDVALLEGGLQAWAAAGAELFRDVNAPSKAFGELVEATRHTPSIGAEELYGKLNAGEDLVVLDARRFDEFNTMSIPSATSVPGGELALRVRDLAPDPDTLVVVNCAGRTRSIIGAQSLINAAIPNRVAALRNGTIGWTLAGLPLEHAQVRKAGAVRGNSRTETSRAARALADRAGVGQVGWEELSSWARDPTRTLYRFDVRTPEEFAAGHAAGFRSAPGGQLVQETDVFAPVRGARVVLADDDGVRANMAASWLAQMGWQVFVVPSHVHDADVEYGPSVNRLPPPPAVATVSARELADLLQTTPTLIVDVSSSAEYARGHLPTAFFALRSQLDRVPSAAPPDARIVLVSSDGVLATFTAPELAAISGRPPLVLSGGTVAWKAAGFDLERGPTRLLAPPIDRYRRPYEGTDNPTAAMQAYLEWEYGLVAQLHRDGTHHFRVI
jgi:rhodanese-related sulfurtransferase